MKIRNIFKNKKAKENISIQNEEEKREEYEIILNGIDSCALRFKNRDMPFVFIKDENFPFMLNNPDLEFIEMNKDNFEYYGEFKSFELMTRKMYFLEKQEEIVAVLNKMTQTEKNKENRTILKSIIAFIMKEKLSQEEIQNLLENLESGGKDMVIEVLKKESEKQRNMGRKEGIIQTAKKLLELGINIDYIEKATGLTKEKIRKL